jgi:hypothetical protein
MAASQPAPLPAPERQNTRWPLTPAGSDILLARCISFTPIERNSPPHRRQQSGQYTTSSPKNSCPGFSIRLLSDCFPCALTSVGCRRDVRISRRRCPCSMRLGKVLCFEKLGPRVFSGEWGFPPGHLVPLHGLLPWGACSWPLHAISHDVSYGMIPLCWHAPRISSFASKATRRARGVGDLRVRCNLQRLCSVAGFALSAPCQLRTNLSASLRFVQKDLASVRRARAAPLCPSIILTTLNPFPSVSARTPTQ